MSSKAQSNGIELEHESFGDSGDPPLLLVMGLGAQMTAWDEAFCRQLADRGLFVTRFDNRDVGLSTWLDEHQIDFGAVMGQFLAGQPVDAPYDLSDMADDAFGLLDHLGIDSAHVVGASMGGMIAQTMAIRSPDRVRSLTSIMSTTGDRAVGGATSEAMALLMTRPPDDREAFVENSLNAQRVLHGAVLPFDEARSRRMSGEAFDRGYHPDGAGRQIAGIFKSGDRTQALATLSVPTLVIHGDADPLVDVSGGRATAATVPGAELHVVAGMGHDLPPVAWDEVVSAIADFAGKAEAGRGSAA